MDHILSRSLPFWKLLTAQQKKQIEEHCVCQSYKKGEIIYNSLKDSRGIKVVKNGRIRISIPVSRGELLIQRLGAEGHCILGVFPQLTALSWDVHMEAETDSEVLSVPESIYNEISGSNPAVSEFNHKMMIMRISEIIHFLSEMTASTVEQRLAFFLLCMEDQLKKKEIDLTHEMIAKDLCTAREVVSRLLKKMEHNGYVKLGRGYIILKDTEGLNMICNS